MKKLIKKYLTRFSGSQLMRGSIILFVGTMIGNFGSYLYHLVMGRMLGPEEYGVVSSIISILYFLSIPTMVFTLVISKFISAYIGKGEKKKIGFSFLWLFKKSFLFSSIIFFFFLLISSFLARFLKLDSIAPLLAVSGAIFLSFPLSVNRGFLQGVMNFTWLALVSGMETILKLFLAVLLVLAGLKSFGATLAYSISSFLNLLIATIPFKSYFSVAGEKEKFADFGKMVKFSLPVLITNVSFISLYSLDIVLVKHFFSPIEAGLYSSVSVLGKIIFWFSSPVVTAVFPILSKRQAEKRKFLGILLLAIILVGFASFGLVLVYKLFPEMMIFLLFGEKYLAAKAFLAPFAVFIFFHTLSNALVNAYLSLSLTKPVALAAMAAVFQGILINLFHKDLFQVILISQLVCGILLASLLFFIPKIYALQKKER